MLERALTLVIPGGATKGMNSSDLDKLIQTYAIAEAAQNDFLAGRLSFQEYIDLVETANVNIDSYLETLESNLQVLQLI